MFLLESERKGVEPGRASDQTTSTITPQHDEQFGSIAVGKIGMYLAEHCTKSDEYAKDETGGYYNNVLAVVLCRVELSSGVD